MELYLSSNAGVPRSFTFIGLEQEVPCLLVVWQSRRKDSVPLNRVKIKRIHILPVHFSIAAILD
jgi:hypothetical protein